MKATFAAAFALFLSYGSAFADATIEIAPHAAAPSSKTAIVISPEALAAVMAAAHAEPGQDTWVAIYLAVGAGGGIRLDIFPYSNDYMKIGVEAQVGLAGSNTGLSAGIGGGVRIQFKVASDHAHNALLISPGVDLIVAPGVPGESWVHLAPYSNIYFVAADTEISWLHQFAAHFGFELGVYGGADVSLGGLGSSNQETRGTFSPRVGLFTGLRF